VKGLIAALAISTASCIGPTLAFADDEKTPGRVDASVPMNSVAEHGGNWFELTLEQWQFLRGIYAVNPNTPAGLPYGDKAALAQIDGNANGLVFFIDGDKACTPMLLPHELLGILRDVARARSRTRRWVYEEPRFVAAMPPTCVRAVDDGRRGGNGQ
jgi:hypothetical protein